RHTRFSRDWSSDVCSSDLGRRREQPRLMALAIDHRSQLEEVADRVGADRARIGAFKLLAVAAAARVADGRDGFGVLLDDKYGRRSEERRGGDVAGGRAGLC